jgi:two-component system chemotaxis sensor kinase CheA
MADSRQFNDILKNKATLLIQREREVHALRLGRERMMAWLHAFHFLALNAQPESGIGLCAAWTRAMIEELHFQTAAAYLFEPATGRLILLHGQSHTALASPIVLGDVGRRLLRERRDGVCEPNADDDLLGLAHSLRLQRFLWHIFGSQGEKDVLLVAGVATGVSGAQEGYSDDLINFVMLGRHLTVLLHNALLIEELDATSRHLQETFDHMRQAIVAFDDTGRVGRVSSRQARLIFEREKLEGTPVSDLLYGGLPDYDVNVSAFREWVQMAFTTPAADFPACELYAPRECAISRPGTRPVPLELEFRPLVRDGKVAQIMLLATDVSVERELAQATRTHEEEDAQRLAALRRVIAGGPQVFLAFVESARERIAACEAALAEHPSSLSIEVIDALFRHAHTVRGEARAFDLVELEDATEHLEDVLDELRGAARHEAELVTPERVQKLQFQIERTRRAFELSCELLAAASPAGRLVFDQVAVRRSTLRSLLELAGDRDDPVGQLVAQLAAVPLGVVAVGVLESTPAWAAQQGVSISLRVEPRELMVPERLARVLPGVLAHLVRNAIAHGIEDPEARTAAGKPEQGTVLLRGEQGPDGIVLSVSDDGRGLNASRVLELAPAGVVRSAEELVFLPGLSTRKGQDELAGRGVGLDAVRNELSRVGYNVSLTFTPGRGTVITLVPEGRALRRVARPASGH